MVMQVEYSIDEDQNLTLSPLALFAATTKSKEDFAQTLEKQSDAAAKATTPLEEDLENNCKNFGDNTK